MTWPLEGSREIDEGIIISEPMDWCKSPTAIVPYRIYAFQRDAMNLAYTVRQTSDPTHVKDSIVLKCYGDEPGVGGGVISGTHNAECTPKTWSESVTAEGRNVVRHTDEWWMNHKNTYGVLLYQKDMNLYTSPQFPRIQPSMSQQDARAFEASYTSDGTQMAQAVPLPEPIIPEDPVLPPGETPGGVPEDIPPGPEETPRDPSNDNEPQSNIKPKGTPDEGEGSEPEPRKRIRPAPKPRPKPQPRGFRVSGCLGITVCFDLGIYNRTEYSKQLSEQEGVLNSKTPSQNLADMATFDANSEAMQAAGQDAARNYNQITVGPMPSFPGGVAATHRLDMVMGGNTQDIPRWGDKAINSAIGGSWPGYRKEYIRAYAEEMAKRGCPMHVHLDLCGNHIYIYPVLTA